MNYDNMDKVGKDYKNGEITVVWTPRLCDHSGVCISELPDVFNTIKRPWINMEGAPTMAIKRVVDLCPTRALVWKENEKTEETKEDNKEKQLESKNGARDNRQDKRLRIIARDNKLSQGSQMLGVRRLRAPARKRRKNRLQ